MQMDPIGASRSAWPAWASFLRRHGLDNLAIFVLESGGPLAIMGAQALYLGSPFLRPVITDVQRDALTGLLEDQGEASAFATFLRKEKVQ
jgi:hypothetical protein